MNIKFLEVLRTWNIAADKFDNFSEFTEYVCNSVNRINKLNSKLTSWFTLGNFVEFTFFKIFSSILFLILPIFALYSFMDISFKQSLAIYGVSFTAFVLSGFFYFEPKNIKKEKAKLKEKLEQYEEFVLPLMKNNETLAEIIPEMNDYYLKNNSDFMEGFMFRALNEQLKFSDINAIHNFLTYYFKTNVNVTNFAEIVQSSSDMKNGNKKKAEDNQNYQFFSQAS